MNIVLIGYRGSGKTTIGRRLAEKLGREFVDTDVLLVERAGKTIKEIFETEGEKAFRDRESAAIVEATAGGMKKLVIAVGGGAVLRPENVAELKRHGKMIWLQADVGTLHARITGDTTTSANRPNLTAVGGLEEIKGLLATRTPLYQAAADGILDVSRLSVEEAVGLLIAMIER